MELYAGVPHKIRTLVLSSRWGRSDLLETAFVAITVVVGLQLLRVLLAELVFYIRDSLGAGSIAPGAYALVLFSVAFLAPPIYRALGPRRTVLLTSGGLALVRLAEQLVPWPAVDLGLATLGTGLLLWFIPAYVGYWRRRGDSGGQAFATGLLLGIAIDTAIKGAFATLDLSWQPGAVSYTVVVVLVMVQGLLLGAALLEPPRGAGDGPGFPHVTPVLALGPILFLELLLFQNIGQQTALIGWGQPLVFLWIVMANAVGMVAAMGIMARPGVGGPLVVAALAGLLVLLALGERSGVAAAVIVLYGQVTISLVVGIVGVAVGSGGSRPGVGAIAVASGFGMLLLLLLTFLYYVNYEFDVPGGTAVMPPIAVALVLLFITITMPVFARYRRRPAVWAPAAGAFLLLALPLGYLAAWEEPGVVAPSGFPVRVMSYNLHQGFDVNGYLAIERLADAIEEQKPDIVAVQEVSRGWIIDGSFDMLPWLARRLDMPYVWGPAADSVWGNALFSRYPIFDASVEPMPNNPELQLKRSLIKAKVDLGAGEYLTVIATHLHHKVDEGHMREPQVRAVLNAWRKAPRSVIMGDLNALPDSPEMLLLAEAGLKDAFIASRQPPLKGGGGDSAAGGGLNERNGFTVPSKEPSKRIDYIWVSSDLEASNFALTDSLASDHLGLAVTLDG